MVASTRAHELPKSHQAPVDRHGQPIDLGAIGALVNDIVGRWNPQQIWLFGSRARGDARPESDWDLLVIVDDDVHDFEFDPLIGWGLQRDAHVRADIFPCRARDFQEDTTTPNTLAYDAATEGVLIHER